MSSPLLPDKKVLLIGNGWAGSQIAAGLAKIKGLHLTVLTPFEYQEVSFRMTKVMATSAEEHDKTIYPLTNTKEDNVEYVIDQCTSLRAGACDTIKNGTLAYDYCVIATGSKTPIFMPALDQTTTESRRTFVQGFQQQVQAAKSIVIAGAGPIGVEMAADIKLRNPSISVTIVNPSGKTLSEMPVDMQKAAEAQLAKIGVQSVVDAVTSDTSITNGQITLKSGAKLACDLFIPAFNGGPHSDFLEVGHKDAKGLVKVDAFLQVTGLANVFAVGDVANVSVSKSGSPASDQAAHVVTNITLAAQGKKLKPYAPSFPKGQVTGPLMVGLGHGVKGAYGIGPNLPGCFCSWCCWCCCISGAPCSTAASENAASMKSSFNESVFPSKGFGISDGNKSAGANRPFGSNMTR